jgi:hypothetical protein
MTDKPINPYKVLATALIPGAGHVLLGLQQRGLMFLFFTIILGWVSTKIIPVEMSFFSRHVGGIFVYGISILDAYKTARIRKITAKYDAQNQPKP